MAKKETKKKQKKMKGKANAAAQDATKQSAAAGVTTNINNLTIDRSRITAADMTQAQIEEAIKESQDPSSRLKKLRSPLSIRSCLLNILILVAVTVAIVILCCYLLLDKQTFNLGVVLKDMLNKIPTEKHSIMWLFKTIGNWFKNIFT